MSTYSFMDTQATLTGIGGSISLGYGAENAKEGITVAMANDKNAILMGADGSGMNTLRADKSGTFTVRLLKTSPANSQLQTMYNLQSLRSDAWGNNVMTVSQTGVGDIITGRQVAFKKVPDMNYKEDADIVEWVFDSIKVDRVLGTYN